MSQGNKAPARFKLLIPGELPLIKVQYASPLRNVPCFTHISVKYHYFPTLEMEYFGSFLGCSEFRNIVCWGSGNKGIVHLPPFLFNFLTSVKEYVTSLEESDEDKARETISMRNTEGGSNLFYPAEKLEQALCLICQLWKSKVICWPSEGALAYLAFFSQKISPIWRKDLTV